MTKADSTSENEAPPRVRSLLKTLSPNLALIAASTAIALLVAEVTIRIVAPQQLILIRPDVWQPADTVGWLHRPNLATQINTGERTASLFTDADGFRVGASGPVRAHRRVLVLGDSFMEALQVDYEDSGPGLLEGRLADMLNEPIGIRNAGIGGWDPDQYLLRAQELLPADNYDAVLVAVYLGNDILEQARPLIPPRQPVRRARIRFPRTVSWHEFVDAFIRPVNDLLEVRSHLYILIKNRLQGVRMRMGLDALAFPPAFLTETKEDDQWEVTAELLERIRTLAQVQAAHALFVLIPAPFQIDPDDLTRYVEGYGIDPRSIDLEQPNRILAREFQARHLDFVDLLPAFRQAHENGTQLYGSVDQHFTPEGNLLFADVVTPHLLRVLMAEDTASIPARGAQ
jgi:hypothetical protein